MRWTQGMMRCSAWPGTLLSSCFPLWKHFFSGPDAQALATILAVYAQRHGGPSQLAADRLVALLTAPTDSAPGTLPICFRFFFGAFPGSLVRFRYANRGFPCAAGDSRDDTPGPFLLGDVSKFASPIDFHVAAFSVDSFVLFLSFRWMCHLAPSVSFFRGFVGPLVIHTSCGLVSLARDYHHASFGRTKFGGSCGESRKMEGCQSSRPDCGPSEGATYLWCRRPCCLFTRDFGPSFGLSWSPTLFSMRSMDLFFLLDLQGHYS